ncbi:hypothetical protein ARMSODRAFT_184491 [Armillaria solidipes]|uniref:Uncharacterized protein n=1 Tax=Armillaria solidipes TaxID=1076256 RepID=A0A2H3BCP3_9AGAR|nr:hypothetical protein ARMSODRAFT_184491 [Armillaria solidipes]
MWKGDVGGSWVAGLQTQLALTSTRGSCSQPPRMYVSCSVTMDAWACCVAVESMVFLNLTTTTTTLVFHDHSMDRNEYPLIVVLSHYCTGRHLPRTDVRCAWQLPLPTRRYSSFVITKRKYGPTTWLAQCNR